VTPISDLWVLGRRPWPGRRAASEVCARSLVHPLVVEALLAPLKRVPRDRYLWPNAGKPRPEPSERSDSPVELR
jgi:hypothetical protein